MAKACSPCSGSGTCPRCNGAGYIIPNVFLPGKDAHTATAPARVRDAMAPALRRADPAQRLRPS
jgi:hypothetical protein